MQKRNTLTQKNKWWYHDQCHLWSRLSIILLQGTVEKIKYTPGSTGRHRWIPLPVKNLQTLYFASVLCCRTQEEGHSFLSPLFLVFPVSLSAVLICKVHHAHYCSKSEPSNLSQNQFVVYRIAAVSSSILSNCSSLQASQWDWCIAVQCATVSDQVWTQMFYAASK